MDRIRTRETYTSPVRTIDRAALLSRNMRGIAVRTKDGISRTAVNDHEQNESSYAGDRTFRVAELSAVTAKDAAIKGYKGSKKLGDFAGIGKKKAAREQMDHYVSISDKEIIIVDSEKEYENYTKYGSKVLNNVKGSYQNRNNPYHFSYLSPDNRSVSTERVTEKFLESGRNLTNSVTIQAEKGEKILKQQYRAKRAREALRKRSERSGKKALASLKRTIKDSKVIAGAISVTGCIALITIIVCTFFGSAFYILGDESNADFVPGDFIGIGDGSIVEVAASQVGNVGGSPYWSWYGFHERVEWCACFVSWCAYKCGYIEDGIIPKFAGVGTGIEWFQKRGQWQSRGYRPMPGDIIFFDWDGDGYGNHVGIVESSDDRYVYTIEGNSGDKCCRRTYFITSSMIMGYGIPKYPEIIDEETDY